MFSRQSEEKDAKIVDLDWQESLTLELERIFKHECKEQNKHFDVYARMYPKELLLIGSLVSNEDAFLSAISIFISMELENIDNKNVEQELEDISHLLILIFEDCLKNQNEFEYCPIWVETTHQSKNYYYKITRENIALTIQSNELLGKDFLV